MKTAGAEVMVALALKRKTKRGVLIQLFQVE